jgi:cardiolipin synthase
MVTLPNLITVCRIVLTPFVVLALMAGNCRRALGLCVVAGVSDGLDGFLARTFHWESRAGAYLDPVADKFLLTAVYFSLGFAGLAPWWLVWLVIGRDVFILAMVAFGFFLFRHRDFPPSMAGKISTAMQIFTASALLTFCAAEIHAAGAARALIWTTAATTTCSGIDYAIRGLGILRKIRSQERHSFS